MIVSTSRAFVFVLLSLLFIGGCNLFDPLYRSGRSDNIGEIIEDARFALLKNDTGEAIRLLDHALTIEPEHGEARILLGSTILRHEGIQLLLLQNIAGNLTSVPSDSLSTPSETPSFCSFNEDTANLKPVYLADIPAYIRLEIAQNPLRRVVFLLDDVFDEEASPLAPNLLAQGLMARGTARLGIALVEIKKMTALTAASWYHRDEASIGVCSESAESLSTLTSFLACSQADQMNQGIGDLELRETVLQSTNQPSMKGIIVAFYSVRDAILSTIQSTCIP
jgi:hypothetical protein